MTTAASSTAVPQALKKCCGICNIAESSYRCPNCRIQYCSVPCFRKHKVNGCQKIEQIILPSNQREAKTKVKAEGDEEEELPYIVSAEQFQKLDASDALKKPLRDTRLQSLLIDIDKSENPLKTIKEAIENYPEFAEFASEILKTIGIRDEHGRCVL